MSKEYKTRPERVEPLTILQLGLHYRDLEKTASYADKVEELKKTGSIQLATENLIPLVTNSYKYPNSLEHLPQFILFSNDKIKILKKKTNIIKLTHPSEAMLNTLLCEPWRKEEDFDQFEEDLEVEETAKIRRKKILPYSSDFSLMLS